MSPEPVPPAPPPPPQRAILRDLVVARAQRGFVVRGRVTLGYSDSTLRATLRGAHASASALLVRRHLRAGAERFAVRLGPRARAALAHASHEALVLRVTVTGPGGRTATATRRIVLRR